MTKKERLIELFKKSIECKANYIAVSIETRGNDDVEIIVNPRNNFDNKLVYYCKAYNDDLVLNTYDGIRIVSVLGIQNDTTMNTAYEALLDSEI